MKETSRSVPTHIRKEVRIRDENKCRKCGINKNLEFHHIISFFNMSKNNKWKEQVHQKNNVILLCENCHDNAPDDPCEFFKWLKKYPELPVSYSKCIELISMGLPMLILKRESEKEIGYNLSIESNDWKELLNDMELFLKDLWDLQINKNNSLDGISDIMNKFVPKDLDKIIDKVKNKTKKDL